jgi:hypothetical protein
MTEHIIIISVFIISILLWFYYIKSKDQDDKYVPVMIRQSEIIHENNLLKQESKKLKTRIKYLQKYKDDVSKTFRILDNELVLINEHIKRTPQSEQLTEQEQQHITSFTPSILNSLLNYTNTQNNDNHNHDNNIFNQFLTENLQEHLQPVFAEEIIEEINQEENKQEEIKQETSVPEEVLDQIRLLNPLNSNYNRYLLNDN